MTDTINLLYEIIQLITPPDTGKSPPTAYRFSQLKQGTYLIWLNKKSLHSSAVTRKCGSVAVKALSFYVC